MLEACHRIHYPRGPLSSGFRNIGIMTSNFFTLPLLAAPCSRLRVQRLAALDGARQSGLRQDIPDRAPDAAGTLDAYLSARQATPLGCPPKGQLLIATRFGDVDQLAPGRSSARRAPPDHVPARADHAGGVLARSQPQRLLLRADCGRKRKHADLLSARGGAAGRLLTDGKSMNGGAVWSNAGREIAFFSTARDGVSYDIDIVDPEGGALAASRDER